MLASAQPRHPPDAVALRGSGSDIIYLPRSCGGRLEEAELWCCARIACMAGDEPGSEPGAHAEDCAPSTHALSGCTREAGCTAKVSLIFDTQIWRELGHELVAQSQARFD